MPVRRLKYLQDRQLRECRWNRNSSTPRSAATVATDNAGNVYVVDANAIRKITSAGLVITLADTSAALTGADGDVERIGAAVGSYFAALNADIE